MFTTGYLLPVEQCPKAIKNQHQITKIEKNAMRFCFKWRLVYFCIHLITGIINANKQN